MRMFRREMPRHRMIQRSGCRTLQHCRRGRADEPVEDDRNAQYTGAQDGPGHEDGDDEHAEQAHHREGEDDGPGGVAEEVAETETSEAAEELEAAVEDVQEKAEEVAAEVEEKAEEVAAEVEEKAEEAVEEAKEAVEEAQDEAKEALDNAADKLNNALGGSTN